MRQRTSLVWRVTASCLLVALVAVGVAGAVSVRLVAGTARQVAQTVLAQQADVIAAQLDEAPAPARAGLGLGRVAQVLQGQGIVAVPLGPRARATRSAPIASAVQQAGADRALLGQSVSAAVDIGAHTYLVQGRPAPSGGFALVRRIDSSPLASGLVERNIGIAVLAGAGAAVLVGMLVGRLLGAPLRRTAAAAHLLRSGRRDVRVPVAGPREIAEVATAVNELADALTRSERRQREFLLSVSHELRTPLTAVRGFAESLADGVVTGPDVAPTGAIIHREALRLDRLVGDLIELARLEADQFPSTSTRSISRHWPVKRPSCGRPAPTPPESTSACTPHPTRCRSPPTRDGCARFSTGSRRTRCASRRPTRHSSSPCTPAWATGPCRSATAARGWPPRTIPWSSSAARCTTATADTARSAPAASGWP
jgi:signal transduction histidine kinase